MKILIIKIHKNILISNNNIQILVINSNNNNSNSYSVNNIYKRKMMLKLILRNATQKGALLKIQLNAKIVQLLKKNY